MCGRYAAARGADDLREEFEVAPEPAGPDGPVAGPGLPWGPPPGPGPQAGGSGGPGQGPAPGTPEAAGGPDWNVAPTKVAPVVLARRPRGAPDSEPARRWLRGLTWGLVPSWAKDRSVGPRMINGRVETVLDKPAFRRAVLARRCLVPADGWYEWQTSPSARTATGRPRKQPFYLHPLDGAPLALAGVYEFWRDPARDADDPGAWLTSYAVLTTAAETALAGVHDRMPMVLPRDRWPDWLDPELTEPDAVRALLAPPATGRFVATPVSTRVNAVANNGPELVEPVPGPELTDVLDPATGELF